MSVCFIFEYRGIVGFYILDMSQGEAASDEGILHHETQSAIRESVLSSLYASITKASMLSSCQRYVFVFGGPLGFVCPCR